MVTLSFSMEGLLYKILRGEKLQSFRVLGDEGNKWHDAQEKLIQHKDVTLNLHWKQRSPTEHLAIGDLPCRGIDTFDMHHLTEQDAMLDGAPSLTDLESFFRDNYKENWREKPFARVSWSGVPNADLVKPNSTKIDWFDELCTVNPLIFPKGCPYKCRYCYARQMQVVRKLPNLKPGIYPGRLAGIQFAAKHVFMESMGDLFHPIVPSELIRYVIEQANFYNKGRGSQLYYLTKNPARYLEFLTLFDPQTTWLGTTVETDAYNDPTISDAPRPGDRVIAMEAVQYARKFVSIEPIMQFAFNARDFAKLILDTGASLVFVGANTSNEQLKEPTPAEIDELITSLQFAGITVVKKQNLVRLEKLPPHTVVKKELLARVEERLENPELPSHEVPICPKCHLPQTKFQYDGLERCQCDVPQEPLEEVHEPETNTPVYTGPTNGKTLVITGCCKEKLDHATPAKDLYQGRLFKLVRQYAELNNLDWVIISAMHGLVRPEQVIEPYEAQIKTIADVKRVTALVMPVLGTFWGDYAKIIVIMGKKYRQVIDPPLSQLAPRQQIEVFEDKRGIGGLLQKLKALLPEPEKPKLVRKKVTGDDRARFKGYVPITTFIRRGAP